MFPYQYYNQCRIIRIFHDNSIDTSIICQIECDVSRNSSSRVDFCNIEQMPYDLQKTWQAKYMHVCLLSCFKVIGNLTQFLISLKNNNNNYIKKAMTWRYLSLGDSFVDFMASRDIDSSLIEREIDSVNVWLNSNTLFHVMRGSN